MKDFFYVAGELIYASLLWLRDTAEEFFSFIGT